MIKFLKNPPVFLFFLFVIGVIWISANYDYREGPEHREFRGRVETWHTKCDAFLDVRQLSPEVIKCVDGLTELKDEASHHGWTVSANVPFTSSSTSR